MYLLYHAWGFGGIYVFVLIMSGAIAAVFFHNLLKEKNNLILVMHLSASVFAARNQIFSFLIFELEIYGLIGLLEQGKKRYFWFLILVAFLLVLFHDTLYLLYFLLAMPYLGDFILSKLFHIEKLHKFENSNLKNIKYLIILLVLAVPIGFCTPIFASTYTNLINCMNGVSATFISELKPVNIIQDMNLLTITFLVIGMIGFTKTKFKIKDILFVLGLLLFAMMAGRNVYFLYLIGLIYFTNMLTACMDTYIGKEKVDAFWEMIGSSKFVIVITVCFISIISVKNLIYQLVKEYVNDIHYPKQATEWILKNVDCENMRIWTHFNWGSYLELNGIKVFLDSRSGMYTEQENKGCSVLSDWLLVEDGSSDYQEIFEKYQISHILVENSSKLNRSLSEDNQYQVIYQDNLYVLYEKEGF